MQQIKYGSVCSGIEAASVAWHEFGWEAAWFSEIDAFPSAVLQHHWPHVSNLGDMTKIRDKIFTGEVEAPDILVGGTPCQAFSVAGARKSLDDDRGQLTLEYVRLANAIDEKREEPCITVWENVPGVLNTKDNAFGCFLGALAGESGELKPSGGRWGNAGCVFGPQRSIAWRILDAQYFGVAQRRRRVFVVASARKGFNPAKVLFEWESLRRDTAPSRSAWQDATGSATQGFAGSSRFFDRQRSDEWGTQQVASTIAQRDYKSFTNLVIHGTQDPIIQDNQAFPLGRNQGQENVVFGIQGSMIGRSDTAGPQDSGVSDDISFTLTKGDRHGVATSSHFWNGDDLAATLTKNSDNQRMPDNSNAQLLVTHQYVNDTVTAKYQKGADIPPMGRSAGNVVIMNSMVRRLTPIECERLQGFPDNHTQIPYRNKTADLCPDGPRYAACGNSMAVPVMAWIGNRINEILRNESI